MRKIGRACAAAGHVNGKQLPLNSGEVGTVDDQYIRDSILLPGKQISAGYDNLMPSFTGHISEAEIMQIVGYPKSIDERPQEVK
jgi:cytochrome c oxidase subunit 2